MEQQLNRQQRRKQEREFQEKRKSALSKRYSGTEVQKIVFQTMLDTFEASKAMHHDAMKMAAAKVDGVGPVRTGQLIEHFDEAFDVAIQEKAKAFLNGTIGKGR
ncbi:hypothetical protein EVJ32_09525 [Exiguobacterium sp. SH5S4]|uniref:hypothetical protein n=1 Tax=Exiguobacterium sp. SH5S4 TaxID=2510961 RepID=UPI001040CC64|nr:hypothetical protein [Exiguobacterium sp. SH5S4]TCI25554.1 hypothetical protein EVJ32_09525 [Exiguobacterium sp. SH5S4]